MGTLPDDLLIRVLALVDGRDIVRFERLSKRFRSLIRSNRDSLRKVVKLKVEIYFEDSFSLHLHPPPAVHAGTMTVVVSRPPEEKKSMSEEIVLESDGKDNLFYRFRKVLTNRPEMDVIKEILKQVMFHLSFVEFGLYNFFCAADMLTVMGFLRQFHMRATIEDTSFTTVRYGYAPNMPKAFFLAPEVLDTTGLEIVLKFSHSSLDDETLLSLQGPRELIIRHLKTEVTLGGLRKLIEQWTKGERNTFFDKLVMSVKMTDPAENYRTVHEVLHDCCRECERGRIDGWPEHLIWNEAHTEALSLWGIELAAHGYWSVKVARRMQ